MPNLASKTKEGFEFSEDEKRAEEEKIAAEREGVDEESAPGMITGKPQTETQQQKAEADAAAYRAEIHREAVRLLQGGFGRHDDGESCAVY
jgi:hypothetical protein